MPSPFPGMDPYLEDPAGWGGVHSRLIVFVQDELNRLLPRGLVAEIDEYVWVQEDDAEGELLRRRRVKPDVFLPASDRPPGGPAAATLTAPTAEGVLRSTRRRRRYLRIVDAAGQRVVTAIELLSPANKAAGPDRAAYLQKRADYLRAVNFVEIDLLRGGVRSPIGFGPPLRDYYVLACRPGDAPPASLWTWGVRDPLPVVGVPLAPGTPPVPLALRPAFDRVYDGGRYGERAPYDLPPTPPLTGEDAAWAADLLRKTLPAPG